MQEGKYYQYLPTAVPSTALWTSAMLALKDTLSAKPERASQISSGGGLSVATLLGMSAAWIGEWGEFAPVSTGQIQVGDFYISIRTPNKVHKATKVWSGENKARLTATGFMYILTPIQSVRIATSERGSVCPCPGCGLLDIRLPEYQRGLCDNCYRRATEVCFATGVRRFKDEMITVEGNWYSADHAPAMLTCTRCATKRVATSFKKILDIEGVEHAFCSTCARGSITSYHTRPQGGLLFHPGGGKPASSRPAALTYIGAEIETTHGMGHYTNPSLMLLASDQQNELYFQNTDGSLRWMGFEWITMPMTMQAWEEKKEFYRKLFGELVKQGMRAHDTNCCGLHFHISRTGLTSKAIEDLFVLFERNFTEFLQFSRRTVDEHFRWCSRLLRGSYAQSVDMASYDPYQDKDRGLIKHAMACPPRGAINIRNRDTIEFRMFKGTLNFNTFWASLVLVHTCVRYVKEAQIRMEDTTFDALIEFAHDDNLKAYWESRKAQPQYLRQVESA